MAYRSRTIYSSTPSCVYNASTGALLAKTNVNIYSQTCSDENPGFGRDNPFYVIYNPSSKQLRMSGVNAGFRFDAYYLTCPSIGLVGSSPNGESLVSGHLARANPNRPAVSLPNFIYELGDIPKMIHWAGKTLFQTVAKSNLNWQFGLKPLLSDLKKLYDFRKVVDRRLLELESLTSKSGLHRRTMEAEQTDVGNLTSYTLNSTYATTVKAKYRDTCTRRQWLTSRWEPTEAFLADWMSGSRADHYAQAILHAYGLANQGQLDFAAWESIPWSWLVDWFLGIQDFSIGCDNSIAHTVGNHVCYMRTSITSREWSDFTKPSGISIHEPEAVPFIRKQRWIYDATSKVAFRPFLSGRQWSILGSLAILRGR